ncbi:MAG: hypothetical protein ACLT63_00365 [Bacteroides xylanisolvens]
MFVDEEREEIYVVGSVFKIQVYSLSGNYKRTLNFPMICLSNRCLIMIKIH